MEWQRDLKDPTEFIETVKIDLFDDEVFVFTPKGDVKALPKGATPDRPRVRDSLGGRRSLLGRARQRPDRAAALRAAQRRHRRDPHLGQPEADQGLAQVRRHQPRQDEDPALHPDGAARAQPAARAATCSGASCASRSVALRQRRARRAGWRRPPTRLRVGTADDLLVAVGYGKVSLAQAADAVLAEQSRAGDEAPAAAERPRPPPAAGVTRRQAVDRGHQGAGRGRHPGPVRQVLHAAARRPIVGFISRGRGVVVHTRDCPKALDLDPGAPGRRRVGRRIQDACARSRSRSPAPTGRACWRPSRSRSPSTASTSRRPSAGRPRTAAPSTPSRSRSGHLDQLKTVLRSLQRHRGRRLRDPALALTGACPDRSAAPWPRTREAPGNAACASTSTWARSARPRTASARRRRAAELFAELGEPGKAKSAEPAAASPASAETSRGDPVARPVRCGARSRSRQGDRPSGN